jgi:voltage-gated potassium channel
LAIASDAVSPTEPGDRGGRSGIIGAMGTRHDHDDPASAYRRFERAVEWPMLVLSLVFVVLLVLPELSDVDEDTIALPMAFIWVLFGVEVAVLFLTAPSKRRMLREHWLDVVIVAAPFLRPLRIARLVRVLRAGSALARVLAGVSAVVQRRGLQLYGAFTVVLVGVSALLVYGFERDAPDANIASVGDALWWAVVTTTTVGYGDRFPVTNDGRAVAVLLMVVGIGLVGVVTANVAAHFIGDEQAGEIAELRAQLDRIEALLEQRT